MFAKQTAQFYEVKRVREGETIGRGETGAQRRLPASVGCPSRNRAPRPAKIYIGHRIKKLQLILGVKSFMITSHQLYKKQDRFTDTQQQISSILPFIANKA